MKATKMGKTAIGKTTDRGAEAMNMIEQLEAVKKVQDFRSEISTKLEEIIASTYDNYCYMVNDFTVGDKIVDVSYEYSCRDEDASGWKKIPIEWLVEGFDYKAAYADELRKVELRRKMEEEAEKKRKKAAKKAAAAKKEKKERELYLKLKAKYEKEGDVLHEQESL